MRNQIIEYDDRSAYEIITGRRELRIVAFGDPLTVFLDTLPLLDRLISLFGIDEIARRTFNNCPNGQNSASIISSRSTNFETYPAYVALLDNKILTYGFGVGGIPKKETENTENLEVITITIIRKDNDDMEELVFKWLDTWDVHEMCIKKENILNYRKEKKNVNK